MLSAESTSSREWERVHHLAAFDLDYTQLKDRLADPTLLASRVAGTPISLINLIDPLTQWTVANQDSSLEPLAREESVCQYTIQEREYLEVTDLSRDSRFQGSKLLTIQPDLRYYLGVPLTSREGYNVGALCVLDTQTKALSPAQIELLQIIAREIVNRLEALRTIHALQSQLERSTLLPKKLVHDVQGPIRSIQEVCQLMVQQGDQNSLEITLEVLQMIQQSTQSILELAAEILSAETGTQAPLAGKITLPILQEKLAKLYVVQAQNKGITFQITSNPQVSQLPFSTNKLLQITGNLIGNALKFTPAQGQVTVTLDLLREEKQNTLHVTVQDTGVGLEQSVIQQILENKASSTVGTKGEQGYGMGLALVASLVQELNGTMKISSQLGQGTIFEVYLPQKQ